MFKKLIEKVKLKEAKLEEIRIPFKRAGLNPNDNNDSEFIDNLDSNQYFNGKVESFEEAFEGCFDSILEKLPSNKGIVTFMIEDVSIDYRRNEIVLKVDTFEVFNKDGDSREASKQEIKRTLDYLNKNLKMDLNYGELATLEVSLDCGRNYPTFNF